MNYQARQDKLYALMRAAGLDALALIPGANHRYLSGAQHYVLERPIVTFYALGQAPLAVIPQLEIPLFQRHQAPPQLFPYTDAAGYQAAFRAALAQLGTRGKTIGVEGLRLRFFEGEAIRQAAPGARVVDASAALAQLRLQKEPAEIDCLRRAIAISEAALHETFAAVRIGMSEIELAQILEARIKALGGHGLAFGTILHAGGNSALPHSAPLPYRIQHGDPLLVDFGATYQGYCADITRTVFVGAVSPAQRDLYDIVLAANAAARAAARPGLPAEALDIAARQVFVDAGCAQLLRHRTGHGIGLEAHEAPYIVRGNQRLLAPGMVFTVEPGAYRLGEIGVRIEDNLLITEAGAESLTSFPRELLVI